MFLFYVDDAKELQSCPLMQNNDDEREVFKDEQEDQDGRTTVLSANL
jgi:hypothetical protein